MVNNHWLVVWNMAFIFHFINKDVILPIDELHHFSRWFKPPTRYYMYIFILYRYLTVVEKASKHIKTMKSQWLLNGRTGSSTELGVQFYSLSCGERVKKWAAGVLPQAWSCKSIQRKHRHDFAEEQQGLEHSFWWVPLLQHVATDVCAVWAVLVFDGWHGCILEHYRIIESGTEHISEDFRPCKAAWTTVSTGHCWHPGFPNHGPVAEKEVRWGQNIHSHSMGSGWCCFFLMLTFEPRKKPQCIVYVRELYYITFAKEKCWVAKDRESNLLRERSRKRSLRYFKLFVLFSGNGPVGMDGELTQEV